MSGGAAGAVAGTLTALLSGPPEALARVRPLVDAYAAAVFVVGSLAGDAQTVKVLNNALSAIALAASGEALAVARAAGLDAAATVAAIGSGSGRNSAILEKIPRHVLSGGYDFGFPLKGTLKDTAAALALAAEVGVDMTIAEAARARYEAAAARFGGDADMTRVCDL